MKKFTILMLAVFFAGNLLIAQSIDEGKKFLNYGRNKSAKENFEKMLASNPKNVDALYWLGQTHLAMDDITGAKALYQKALSEGVNDPMIWVGMGHVEILEGNKDAARQRFEAAITSTMEKKRREMVENPKILTAIGRANADGDSKTGDPAYAVEKLRRAVELEPNNAEAYTNLGINYLKLGPDRGGDAYEAFTNAIKADPGNGRPKFRLGKLFLSQNNAEKFLEYFNSAIGTDPNYAPAYLELYSYYSNRDVAKAKEYIEKYLETSDKDCNADYYYGNYLFLMGNYQQSLEKAKSMENGGCTDFPRLKVLYAYNYDRLGNPDKAKENIETFLSNTDPKKIQPDDYLFGVAVLKKFPGGEDKAISYLKKALEFDTVRNNRFKYMDTIAFLYRKHGKHTDRLYWLQQSFETNPNPSNLDIYNVGDAALNAGRLNLADSMFNQYKSKYPDQIFGYLGLSKVAIARDKDTTTGSAAPVVLEFIKMLETKDKDKYKSMILQNYGYLVYVHANVLKDYEAALADLDGILGVDPGNEYALGTKEQIKKVMSKSPGTKPKG